MTYMTGNEVGGNPVDQPKAPSAVGYWLGALLIVLGVGGGIAWGWANFAGFLDAIDDFERVPVGDVGTVDLDAGEYVVYAESGGGLAQSQVVGQVRMRPAGEEGADEIEFQPYNAEFTYDFGSRVGRAQLTFGIEDAGEYEVRVEDLNSATSAAFGPSIASDLVTAIVGAFIIAGIGIVLGVTLLIVTGVRRRKHRQRHWLDARGNGPGGGPAPGTWNPQPPGAPGAWSSAPPGSWNPPPPVAPGYPPPPGAQYPPS